jgi:glycerophosphoryl diester phosphodiesterase
MENDRKKRLYELKQASQKKSAEETVKAGSGVFAGKSGSTEGDDINKFIKEIVERKKERKKQLEIIHDFFENPAAYGVDTDLITSSTTPEEIEGRKKELQHKIDLLRSVLKALEGEMQMLCQMKQPDEKEKSSATRKPEPPTETAKKKTVKKKAKTIKKQKPDS